jgi:ubiquinone/menaquinone biosynthesis C-methylase UbiE
MNKVTDWKGFWENKSRPEISDHEFDRGTSSRDKQLESLSNDEMLAFIKPRPNETILDAGCGTGANICLLKGYVTTIIGMDYTAGAVGRCARRVTESGLESVMLLQGSVTHIPLKDSSVDRLICMSVIQYLTDTEVRAVIKEFGRVLKSGGQAVLHVKNLSSLYLSTLAIAKYLKGLLRRRSVRSEYFRRFGWYIAELEAGGFSIADYSSLNVLMVEGMPKSLLNALQRLELRHQGSSLVRRTRLRRIGSELKIRAMLGESSPVSSFAEDRAAS